MLFDGPEKPETDPFPNSFLKNSQKARYLALLLTETDRNLTRYAPRHSHMHWDGFYTWLGHCQPRGTNQGTLLRTAVGSGNSNQG